MDRDTFYQNVCLLTQAVNKPQVGKYFKQGMFDKPNTVGFQHMTYYLLMIYDAERFGKQLEWPLICKKSEAKYRNDVKDMLTTISQENPDIDFPQILASHLLHASGTKFNSIMANLSTVTLRAFIKREIGAVLSAPKPGPAQEISKIMFTNVIHKNTQYIRKNNKNVIKARSESKEFANEAAQTIKNDRESLFSSRQRLNDLSSDAPVHPSMKKRLVDPNDLEVIQLWRGSFNEDFGELRKNQKRLKEITELSSNVANMVKSIISVDTNVLDGKRLPNIEIEKLSEIKELSPETQVMLYRQHVNGTVVLQNWLSLFNCVLTDLLSHIEKYGFPNLFGCESQILVSCEDIKSIKDLFRTMHDRIEKLTSHPILRTDQNPSLNFAASTSYRDHFDSVLLESSPTININLDLQPSGNEFRDRLELTPVEHVQRALFSKHKRREEENTVPPQKLRSKDFITRINLDVTRSPLIGQRHASSTRLNQSLLKSRKVDEWSTYNDGIYSRVFSTRNKRIASKLNFNALPISSSSRHNSVVDMNMTCDVYNATQLKSHLAENTFAEGSEFFSPKQYPTKENNCASSTRIEDEKSISPMKLAESTDESNKELKTGPNEIESKSSNSAKKPLRRLSISDLVERYTRVRINSTNAATRINFSDNSEEGDKD